MPEWQMVGLFGNEELMGDASRSAVMRRINELVEKEKGDVHCTVTFSSSPYLIGVGGNEYNNPVKYLI